MLENAGKDATEALNKTTHSPIAEEIMWELYIGDVEEKWFIFKFMWIRYEYD